MKALNRRFLEIQKKRPNHGDIINFNAAVEGQKFGRDRIGRNFKKLIVNKDEYASSDVREILAYAFALSGGLNRTPNKGQLAPAEAANIHHEE